MTVEVPETAIGTWPNIAIDPRTGRKAVTGEAVEVPNHATAAMLGSVKLTAEQVGAAIKRNFSKVAVIDDGGDKVEWREGWVCNVGFNFKAIADELNATLGDGECELTAFADVPFNVDYEVEGYDGSGWRDYATLAECSKCGGYVIIPPAYHHVLTCDGDEVYQEYRYCPNCGRKVKR